MKSFPRRRDRIIQSAAGFFAAVVVAAVLSLSLLSGSALAVSNNSEELAFVGLINQYRQSQGLQPLLLSDLLTDSSQKHSSDMGKYAFFDHTTTGGSDFFPIGSTPWDRMAACGYSYNTNKGENIAAGFNSASSVFTAWENSPEHNANMLNGSYKVIGVGFVDVAGSPYGYYWTTDFGGYVDPTAHAVGGSTSPPPADTANPTVQFVTPVDGSTLSGTVPVEISASDDVGVARVEIYINGTLCATATSAPYRFNWNTSGVAGGSYTLQARAYDAAGNVAVASISVSIASTTTTLATTTTTAQPTTTTTAPVTTTASTTTTTTPPSSTTTTVPPTTTTDPPTTTPPTTTSTTALPAPSFSDVSAATPYNASILDLARCHIVNGYRNGAFGPYDGVTRQQFAKMIVLALGYPLSTSVSCAFYDVQTNLDPSDPMYPYVYVATAAEQGITEGKTPHAFGPYDGVTRAELLTMVARAANLAEPPADYVPPFGDFSADHYPWARKAAFAGLLNGLQGVGPNYDFWAPATRGEVCQVLYNLLHQ